MRTVILFLALLLVGSWVAWRYVLDPSGPAARGAVPTPPPSPRIGVSAVHAELYPLEDIGAGWYINWTHRPAKGRRLEFVPMVFPYADSRPVTAQSVEQLERELRANAADYPSGTLFVVGNEIGYRPQFDSRPPRRYAEDFHRIQAMLRSIDPTYLVSTGPVILSQDPAVKGGYVNGLGGLAYLRAIIEAHRQQFGSEIEADLFAATAHVLEGGGADFSVFREQVLGLRRLMAETGQRHRGLLITEVGVSYGTRDPAEIEAYLRQVVAFAGEASEPDLGCPGDANRLVQRLAWFTAHRLPVGERFRLLGLGALAIHLGPTALLGDEGAPTALGAAYADSISQLEKVRADNTSNRSSVRVSRRPLP